jgi:hypothetical protein
MPSIKLKKGKKYYIIELLIGENWPFYVSNEKGEGKELSEDAIFDMIDRYFKDDK